MKKGLSKDQAVFLEVLRRLKRYLDESGAPKERLLKFEGQAAFRDNDVDAWVAHFHSKIDLLDKEIRSGKSTMKAAYQAGIMQGILLALFDPTFMKGDSFLEENVLEVEVIVTDA